MKKVVDQDTNSDSGIKPRALSGRNGAGGVKLPQVVKKTRPSSMHDAPKDSAAAAAGRRAEKRVGGGGGGAGAAARGGGEQASGFKKLQMGINAPKKVGGGPVVVTFEEEEEMQLLKGKQIAPTPPGARGGGRQSHLPVSKGHRGGGAHQEELRGASEHLSIPSTDMDGISDDQLDRLLARARNARN
jgi:hypothetical protein